MKTLRKTCAVVALTCLFSVVADAGDIHAGVTDPPPPPPGAASEEATVATGDVLSEVITSLLSDLLTVL